MSEKQKTYYPDMVDGRKVYFESPEAEDPMLDPETWDFERETYNEDETVCCSECGYVIE